MAYLSDHNRPDSAASVALRDMDKTHLHHQGRDSPTHHDARVQISSSDGLNDHNQQDDDDDDAHYPSLPALIVIVAAVSMGMFLVSLVRVIPTPHHEPNLESF